METINNKFVLTIAGFDPSGGAGILADIKTFEANKVRGMGAISAITYQNDTTFYGLIWVEKEDILKQISTLVEHFKFSYIKIGLIKNLELLIEIIHYLKHSDIGSPIIWDPVLRSTSGYEFHKEFEADKLKTVLQNIYLVTPNTEEAMFLTGAGKITEAAKMLSVHCNVLLKGGHNTEGPGVDYLYTGSTVEKILPGTDIVFPKHGTGCVLSSAIAANLAKGNGLHQACVLAKNYVEQFMAGNESLIGNHYVQ